MPDIENTRFVGDIWNVVARIEGTDEPDRIVLVGNHRDAWVYGAVDPNRCAVLALMSDTLPMAFRLLLYSWPAHNTSGTAGMLEVGRGLGELLRRGWRPRVCAGQQRDA